MIKARPEVEALTPYVAPLEGRRGLLRLDFNESTLGPSPRVLEAIRALPPEAYAAYPEYAGLNEAFAETLGIGAEHVEAFNGVDAAIKAVFDAYGEKGGTFLTTTPTFGYYEPCAQQGGMTIEEVPYAADLGYPLAAVRARLDSSPRLFFICNPNNPTGTLIEPGVVVELARSASQTLIVVDELYAPFTGASVVPEALALDNVVALRSLSKIHGLAALRLGFAVGHPTILERLRRVTGPYDINMFAVVAAKAALSDPAHVQRYVDEVLAAKAWTLAQLEGLRVRHSRGEGNYLLVWPPGSCEAVVEALRARGILVRSMGRRPVIGGSFRLTIGLRADMERFVAAFASVIGGAVGAAGRRGAGAPPSEATIPEGAAGRRGAGAPPSEATIRNEVTAMGDVSFNPMDPDFVADPYPTYHRLRAEDPVHRSPLGFWVLTRYDDVVGVLRDQRFAKEAIASFVAQKLGVEMTAGVGVSMLDRDPPDHTRLRSLVSKAFTPRVVEGLRPRIGQIVDGLLEGAAERRAMDVIEDFAYPIPVVVICEMLGVPVEDHERFRGWSLDLARGLDATMLGPQSEVARQAMTSRRALADYFRELIAERRAAPRADLLSALIAAEEAGDKLSEQELLATCILLLVAGHETTVNLLGNGILALLRHPDQLRLLRESPGLIGTAIEELLRYDGPVQRTARVPSVDAAIAGHKIEAGEMVMPFIGAADRDPAHFPDPDRLDLTRADNRHVAFGMGIHFCLGAPLARLEGQIAISTLVRRFPNLTLGTDRPEYRQSLTLRGLKSLPVAF